MQPEHKSNQIVIAPCLFSDFYQWYNLNSYKDKDFLQSIVIQPQIVNPMENHKPKNYTNEQKEYLCVYIVLNGNTSI